MVRFCLTYLLGAASRPEGATVQPSGAVGSRVAAAGVRLAAAALRVTAAMALGWAVVGCGSDIDAPAQIPDCNVPGCSSPRPQSVIPSSGGGRTPLVDAGVV